MKNVIFILADSIISDCMGKGRTKESSTPFIDRLSSHGFYANNVFSYGPYTDAATIGLYCGVPTLENYGYYFGINSAKNNHFKLFKNAGYETFGFYYPYYLISKNTKSDIDLSVYTGGFKYESVWGGKLKYYQELKQQRNLNELEYKMLKKCVQMVFDCWFSFFSDINKCSDSNAIVKNLKDERLRGTGKKGLQIEFSKFSNNPIEYIDGLLELGMDHPIAKINEYHYGGKKYKDFLKEIYRRHSKEISAISRINTKYAIKNSPLNIKKSFSNIKNYIFTRDKSNLRYFINYGMLLFANNMMVERSLKDSNWQEVASLNKQIEILINEIKDRKSDSPFYASIHALEPHHNISYFSFDSFDHSIIDEDFKYIMPLLKGLGKDFSGNVIYQLSLRYVDLCIKRLVNSLNDLGLLDNTIIALVADHGSSYSFNPLRNTVVNTFHKENYNIPVMIWGKQINEQFKKTTNSFFMSDDILPTLLSAAGLNFNMLSGRDMSVDIKGRPYIITEYMGPGVPDMLTKEVWMSIRNSRYVIAYKTPIYNDIDLDNPIVFYDLETDLKELRNIKLYNNEEVVFLKNALNTRYKVIQKNTKQFVDNIDNLIL